MPQPLTRLLPLTERVVALGLIIGGARLLPGLLPVILLVLAFLAFRRSVFREAASRVARALTEEQDPIPPLTVKDLVVDAGSVAAMAFGAACVPAYWAYPPLAAGTVLLARNAPLRAAARLMQSIERRGPRG